MVTKIKFFGNALVLCAPTQSVVFRRIVKDGKLLFLVKTTKCNYDNRTREFSYEDITRPTWLDETSMKIFLKKLTALVNPESSFSLIESIKRRCVRWKTRTKAHSENRSPSTP